MLQAYSSNITFAANTAIPFNNVTVDKGCAESLTAPATIQLNQRGVYLIKVDGYGTGAAAGTGSIQVQVNGVVQPQAISEFTTAAATISNFSCNTLVQVATNNCNCNCYSSPTTIQVVTGDQALTAGHANIIVTKLC